MLTKGWGQEVQPVPVRGSKCAVEKLRPITEFKRTQNGAEERPDSEVLVTLGNLSLQHPHKSQP